MLLDLAITGAIPKWAIFAPIFVPLLMRLGVEPDAALAAYRIGGSPTEAITPLNAPSALTVTFAQRHQKEAGAQGLSEIRAWLAGHRRPRFLT